MRNIAIIPARSGSKGLKDKNIRHLNGQPLIYYTIQAAIDSGMFEDVIVSTDSEVYAEISRNLGAEVPFLRNKETASDTASSWDVVSEVLEEYKKLGKEYDSFMLLQPTSPLRTADDIRKAYAEMEEKQAISIVSVCEMEHSPMQCNTIPDSLSLDGFIQKEAKGLRRQDMPTYYRFNGAIYLCKVKEFLETKDIYEKECYAMIMDKKMSIDIDDELDFKMAEVLLLEEHGI